MMTWDWSKALLRLFRESRLSPGWEQLKALHDDEDREYFDTLEFHYLSGRLKVEDYRGS